MRWKYQRYVKDYLRCVDSVDENVGRILDYLEQLGWQKTPSSSTRPIKAGTWANMVGSTSGGCMKSRFALRCWSAGPATQSRAASADAMAMNLDFAETFLDIAGAADSRRHAGPSASSRFCWARRPRTGGSRVYYHYYEFPGATVCDGTTASAPSATS